MKLYRNAPNQALSEKHMDNKSGRSPAHKLNRYDGSFLTSFIPNPSSETQGQLVGQKKSKQARTKFGRRKVKNENKSPRGQGFNGPVPNGRSNSGF